MRALIWLLLVCALIPAGLAHAQTFAEPRLVEPLLVVHVSGAVRRPGLYRLPPGTRVADAVQAAGGPLRGSGVGDLELAAELVDGQSIRVPAAPGPPGGRPIVALPASFEPASRARPARKTSRRAATPASRTGRGAAVDVNRASAADLQRLPGVGPGLAARILTYRKRVGRLARVEELREVPGIGEKRLARMAPHVVVR